VALRKFGTEPAQTEVRDEDNDPSTLDYQKRLAAAPETAKAIDDFLEHPETGAVRRRPQR
jgi:hypothetical protein